MLSIFGKFLDMVWVEILHCMSVSVLGCNLFAMIRDRTIGFNSFGVDLETISQSFNLHVSSFD